MNDPFDLMNPDGFRPSGDGDDQNLLGLLPKAKTKHRRMRDPDLDAPGDDDRDLAMNDAPREKKGRETVIYRVGEGDTLIGIAKQFAMDVDDVAREKITSSRTSISARAGSSASTFGTTSSTRATTIRAASTRRRTAETRQTRSRAAIPTWLAT